MTKLSLEESVIRAMDGTDPALVPYLPYILQDSWEIGTDAETIIGMITRHFPNTGKLAVLDLGCGKGAISVQVAKALKCQCHGIDAIPAFIDEARSKALKHDVSQLCRFETGDIRQEINRLSQYDVIILGAIGPVLGNYFQTLTALKDCLRPGGVIIIDDGYIEDHHDFSHPLVLKRSEMLMQIREAGMTLVEENLFEADKVAENNDPLMDNLIVRCMELAIKHPTKKELFLNYIKQQQEESRILEEEVVCSVMLIKRKT